MGLVNPAANLVNRPTNGSASQNMTSNSTYSDRGRYSGSGKCIERQLNIFEVISIIFAGGFCIGQAGILGGRSGRNDFFFLIHVLCLCATLWVMIDLPPAFIYMPGLKPPILLPFLRFLTAIYLWPLGFPS